jgi:magnesium-transporting ATPase (P-type)
LDKNTLVNEHNSSSWHSLSKDAIFEQLNSSEEGLSDTEILERQQRFGLNRLSDVQAVSKLKRFFAQFNNILIYVLIGSCIITALLGHFFDTSVILTVVIANAVIGFIQEGKAENALASIRHMLAPKANVLRNGSRSYIPAELLVPGDLVYLEPGDKVPADCRLLMCFGMFVDEAVLTGESLPSEKHTQASEQNSALGDRHCMVYSGTIVRAGQGTALVVETGEQTEIGRINHLLSKVESLETPLVKQMAIFAKWLTFFILAVAVFLLAYGFFVQDYSFNHIFMAVVSLSVAAIPEGLPAILTITLAIGVKTMAKRNTIVRHLPSIETVGAVSVICTDKTGTLTRNVMLVTSVLTDKHIFSLGGEGYSPSGSLTLNEEVIDPSEHHLLDKIARAALLCNDASIKLSDDVWQVVGDPMEGALLAFSGKVGLQSDQENKTWSRTDVIPFDAEHRYMATLNHNHDGESYVFIKGAPERILAMCAKQVSSQSEPEPETSSLDLEYWQKQADSIASAGQRVLAFGYIPAESHQSVLSREDIDGNVQLLGMLGMIDPPREEAIKAVAECHSAGIKVKMITGDHAGTALAIAKKVGLENIQTVLTGKEIDLLDDIALQKAVIETDVFARTSPEHKLRLVMALQAQNEIVAMTGDGVNDAPALKRADTGIAMGLKGSEAAKEASDLVLADDNFASIVAAVKEGRTVYDNIQKVVSWSLPTSTGEAMVITVALLFGLLLPITPIQILWINLITTVTLGFALAFDPSEMGVMQRKPRRPKAPLINAHLLWHIVLVSFLFVVAVFGMSNYSINQSHTASHAQTLALHTLVILEIFHLLFIRNIFNDKFTFNFLKGSNILWLTISLVLVAQVVVIYLPIFQTIFGTSALKLEEWFIICIVGVVLFIILESEKQLRLLFKRKLSIV